MAFFDKLNDFAKNIGDKTNDAIETGKLNSKINAENNAAGEELKKIGAFYYEQFMAGEFVAEQVLEFCQNAKAHYDAAAAAQTEIDKIKAESEAAKAAAAQVQAAARAAAVQPMQTAPVNAAPAAEGEVICSACGAANAAGVKFCRECGNKMEIPVPAAPAKRFCTACGTEVAPGVRFCPECGSKME